MNKAVRDRFHELNRQSNQDEREFLGSPDEELAVEDIYYKHQSKTRTLEFEDEEPASNEKGLNRVNLKHLEKDQNETLNDFEDDESEEEKQQN
jgi:hypothetical protein